VWTVLGGVAEATDAIDVVVGVTCPLIRIHPAVIAQAAATTALVFDGRFAFGVGTGEALNEHVLGHRWPPPEVRLAMLDEAVDVMRQLWTGETVDHHGDVYTVENARLFDPPEERIPVIVSGFGEGAAELAGRIGDGYWGHGTDRSLLDAYHRTGGDGPRYAQIHVCVGPDVDACRKTAREVWPNAALTGQLAQDLPTWTHFESAVELATEDDVAAKMPCGPDVDAVTKIVGEYVDTGYDHIYLHQVGPDQDALFTMWSDGLQDAMRQLSR
jgi:G6PDH family F420-dependent oxidoreductase